MCCSGVGCGEEEESVRGGGGGGGGGGGCGKHGRGSVVDWMSAEAVWACHVRRPYNRPAALP